MTELNKRLITSFFLLFLLYIANLYNYILISFMIIFFTIVWIEFNGLMQKIFKIKKSKKNFKYIIFSFVGLSYVSFFTYLTIFNFQNEQAKLIYLYSLGLCIVSDIGGFSFGKTFKGKKLTTISPNKTISGCAGAFCLSFLLMIVYYNYVGQVSLYYCLLFGLIVSIFSQIGDLIISYLKRKSKVKNTSNLLPGHGGLLDRVDGILFGVPVGLYFSFLIS